MTNQTIRGEELKRTENDLFLTFKKTYLELKAAIEKARSWGNLRLDELDAREKELDAKFEKVKEYFREL